MRQIHSLTLYDTNFPLQHYVSIAILFRKVGFDSFEYEVPHEISSIAKKFCLKYNEADEKTFLESWSAEVKVKLMNGKELSVHRKYAKGTPKAQLSFGEMIKKPDIPF